VQKTLAIVLFVGALVAPSAAPSATPTAALQYYVGNWTCVGGPVNQKPVHATLTYTLDYGVQREWIYVAAQGTMKTYAGNVTTTFDSKNGRFVQVNLGNDAQWEVSYAKPSTGNVETWTDAQTSSGKLGRGETTRTGQDSFTYLGYATLSSAKPDFRATCRRST